MKKRFKKNKTKIGLILMATSLAFISFWEVAGRENLAYQKVFVVSSELERGDIVTADMFKVQKVDMNADIANLVTNANDIVNMQAVSYVPANTPLVHEYFKESELVLGTDEYVFKIPDKWIVSYPSSLRRGDVAYLYPLDSEAKNSELDYDFDKPKEVEPIKVRIAFVKDSSNKEVRTVGDERLDATSNISSLEIATDVKTFNVINEYVNEGKSFVIYY